MCDPVTASMVLGGLSVANQYQQGEQAKKAQEQASEQATVAAAKAASEADQANNRLNAKQPDLMGINSANTQAAKGGISGTLLTGPQGVDPKALLLGRTTLLGA